MAVTQSIVFLKDAYGADQSFYVVNDGTANAFLSQPAIDLVPVTPSAPLPVSLGATPSIKQIPLDLVTIPTAGIAVNVLASGHRINGGAIVTTNAAGMYVCEIGPAGTAVAAGTFFIPADTIYQISPGTGPLSVNSTVADLPISGFGTSL